MGIGWPPTMGRFNSVEAVIGRALSVETLPAQIPGAQQLDPSHGGQHPPRTHLAVRAFWPHGKRSRDHHLAIIRAGRVRRAQQLAQRSRHGPMQRSPQGNFDRFQTECACFALLLKDKPEYGGYFPFDFPMDGLRRFFSCGVRCRRQAASRRSLHSSRSESE